MALVKCPECNKENVSSTATACPQCGFNVKGYYESLEKKEKSEKRQIIVEQNIKNISDQATSLKEKIKLNKIFLTTALCCTLGLLVIFIVASVFADRQYPIVDDGKTIHLGDSKESVKSRYGTEYSEVGVITIIGNDSNSFVGLHFDESDTLSWVTVDEGSQARLCNIGLNESAVDVFDSLGIDDFNMNEYTDYVLITFDKGKATEAYAIEDSISDFQVQKIVKNSEAVLILKFDELKVAKMSLSYSQYMLDDM